MKALQKVSKFLSDYTSIVVIALCSTMRSGYIFPSVYDGLGKSGTVHRHGIEQVHMSVYYHWYYHVQYGTDTYNGRF